MRGVAVARARGLAIVRTAAVLGQHPHANEATDLHQQRANRYRAELLLNHLAKPGCFTGCAEAYVWSTAAGGDPGGGEKRKHDARAYATVGCEEERKAQKRYL